MPDTESLLPSLLSHIFRLECSKVEASLKKVIFTCGGTAGHVNPAIALAQLMREKDPETEFLFVGAERGL